MTKREWQIAIPILISCALCLAALLYGQRMSDPNDGVAALRVFQGPEGELVAVVANKALHLLDAQGRRVARQDIKTLGFTESPRDMDWTVDDQQRVEAWFWDDTTTPRVVRCVWSKEQSQLVDCRDAMAGPQLKAVANARTVHLAVDRAGQRVFIADAQDSRVQTFSLDGKALASTNPQTAPLYFPNRVRYVGDNTLVVGDNDNRRLAWLRIAPDQSMRLDRTLLSADHGLARKGRGKVTDAALGADGTIWMLAMKQGQKDGDVLVFDAQQRPVARAALADDADPISVEALGNNTALAADYTLVKLHHIDAQGRDLGEFGDDAFRGELKPLQDRAQMGALWQKGALYTGGAIIALGMVLGLLFGQKPKQPGQFDTHTMADLADLAQEGHTLKYPLVLQQTDAYRAEIRKQMRWLGVGAVVAVGMLVFITIPLLQSSHLISVFSQWRYAAPLLAMAIIVSISIFVACRELVRPGELRVSQNKLAWFQGDKMVCMAPLAEAFASTNALLLGHQTIRLRVGSLRAKSGTARFDADMFNRAVLARLPAANLVGDQTLNWQSLKNRPLVHKLLLCGLVLAGILVNLIPLLRKWGA